MKSILTIFLAKASFLWPVQAAVPPEPEPTFPIISHYQVIEEIPYETIIREDDSLSIEYEELIQEGSAGARIDQIQERLYEDYRIEQTVTSTTTPPVPAIKVKGTKPPVLTMETEYGTIHYTQILEDFKAMSYDSTCTGCSETTATGMKAGYGVVAVDPKVIPLYTRVYVPGYGIGIAGDVGGAIKGNKIDLGFDKLEGQWSTRKVDVYILAEEESEPQLLDEQDNQSANQN